jgi:hypothetical protein
MTNDEQPTADFPMNLELLTIDAARSAVQERKTSAAALAESFYAKI